MCIEGLDEKRCEIIPVSWTEVPRALTVSNYEFRAGQVYIPHDLFLPSWVPGAEKMISRSASVLVCQFMKAEVWGTASRPTRGISQP